MVPSYILFTFSYNGATADRWFSKNSLVSQDVFGQKHTDPMVELLIIFKQYINLRKVRERMK